MKYRSLISVASLVVLNAAIDSALAEPSSEDALQAICCSSECFEQKIEENFKQPLFMRNCTKYTYLFFDLYVAALYTDEYCKSVSAKSCSRRLELRYLRDFTVDNFVEGAESILQRQGKLSNSKLKKKVKRFHKLYKPVSKGDSYALQYSEKLGTSLLLNGRLLGSVTGTDFAEAYFGIWLDKKAINDKARKKLLKGID